MRGYDGICICNGRIGGSEILYSVLNSEKEAYGTVPKSLYSVPSPIAPQGALLLMRSVRSNKALLLTKVTKYCAQGENKRREAAFVFTGTVAINAQHLEHNQKEGDHIAAKTISFPKGKGRLTHNNREFSENKEKPFYENIVQIGKKTDTPVVDENGMLTEEAKAAIEVLDRYANTFQERNPNLYLLNCVMHLDEATPHLHIDYIPVAHGYQKGLETRNSLTKAFQQMGFAKAVSRKHNETVAWQEREREYLTELCKEQGIEIEVLGVQRDNLSLPEYKAAMREVEELEQQSQKLIEQIEKAEAKEKAAQEVLTKYDLRAETLKLISKEVEAETKNMKSAAVPAANLFGGEEYVKVKKSDWNKILDAFSKAVSRNHLLEKYEKKISGLEKKIAVLTDQIEKLKRFIASRGLGEAFVEFVKSLAPKTMKQKLEEAKEEAVEHSQQRKSSQQNIGRKNKQLQQEM